ncbi:MAG: CAP domain-containing protein [Candidatus Nanohalobium sp.]
MISTHRLKTRGLNQVKRFLSEIDSQKEKEFKISYHGGKTHYRSTSVVSNPAGRWFESVIEGLPNGEVEPEEVEKELQEAFRLTAVYLSIEKEEDILQEFQETVGSQQVITENFDLELDHETYDLSVDIGGSLPNAVKIYYRLDGDWVDITRLEGKEDLRLVEGKYRFEAVYSGKVIEKEVEAGKDSKVRMYRSLKSQAIEGLQSAVGTVEEEEPEPEDEEEKEKLSESESAEKPDDESEENEESDEISQESSTDSKEEESSGNSGLLKYAAAGMILVIAGVLAVSFYGGGSPEGTPQPVNTSNSTDQQPVRMVSQVFNSSRVAAGIDGKVRHVRSAENLSELNNLESLDQAAYSHSKDMARIGYLNHSSPSGESLPERLEDFSIVCGNLGENLARKTWKGEITKSGFSNSSELASSIFSSWMNDTGDRNRILGEKFEAHGIGVSRAESGQIYVTQIFCG